MPYLSRYERNALVDAIETQLDARFGEAGTALVPDIRELRDVEKYRAMIRVIAQATSLEEVRRAYADVAKAPPEMGGKKGRRETKGKA